MSKISHFNQVDFTSLYMFLLYMFLFRVKLIISSSQGTRQLELKCAINMSKVNISTIIPFEKTGRIRSETGTNRLEKLGRIVYKCGANNPEKQGRIVRGANAKWGESSHGANSPVSSKRCVRLSLRPGE